MGCGTQTHILSRVFSALPRTIQVRGGTEEDFGSKAQGFAERGMGMDRFGDVGHGSPHFDGEHGLGNQLAGARADDAAAQHALAGRVDEPLRQALGAADGLCTAAGRPGETARSGGLKSAGPAGSKR